VCELNGEDAMWLDAEAELQSTRKNSDTNAYV